MMCLWRRMPPQKDLGEIHVIYNWNVFGLHHHFFGIPNWYDDISDSVSISRTASTPPPAARAAVTRTKSLLSTLRCSASSTWPREGTDKRPQTTHWARYQTTFKSKIILSNGLKGFQIAESICGRLRGDAGGQWCKIQATLEQLFGHTGARCTHCMFVAQGKTRKGPCTNEVS